MKVLVIGAHPDDYEISIGGTILKHVSKGDEVYSIVATNGDMIGDPQIRKEEARKSADCLGIKKVWFFNLKDTRLNLEEELIYKIEQIILEIKPTRIYTPSPCDTHQDHRALSNATLSAGRKVKQILFYESPSSQTKFVPNFFIDIDTFLDKKIEAIKLHKSVFTHDKSRSYLEVDAVKGGAFFRGYQSNLNHAESFEVFRFVED